MSVDAVLVAVVAATYFWFGASVQWLLFVLRLPPPILSF